MDHQHRGSISKREDAMFVRRKNGLMIIFLLPILLFTVLIAGVPVKAAGSEYTARPSVNGRLHVDGTGLADESGRRVQLRGVSTHGLTWYPDYINESLFSQVSKDWNCNMIRLAMYANIYCSDEKELSYSQMIKGIEAAVKADMYVLVDWHMLQYGNPNDQVEEAMEFFDRITAQYKDCPNLIFEICNEPNGSTDWGDVLDYAHQVIPVIRKNIPDSLIVVGTPEWDKNLSAAVLRPLEYNNISYSLHFYAATHKQSLRDELQAAIDSGLPVFISECGICEADGDGTIDFASAAEWFTFLNEHKISYAVWSLSDKNESSAFFESGFDPYSTIRDQDMTVSGLWVREAVRGNDPKLIAVPSEVVEKSRLANVKTWIINSLGERGTKAVSAWTVFALISAGIIFTTLLIGCIYRLLRSGKRRTYDDIVRSDGRNKDTRRSQAVGKICLIISVLCTLIYMCWRICYSVPFEAGPVAIAGNILLLIVEILGFVESLILFRNLMGSKKHPLPVIPDDKWPDVDIFIATYNEPEELLRKTINGCKHLKYPDPARVHIWLCDDNRRSNIRSLADRMGVGYFDRPDNKGAKAGNLNNALAQTSAPYIVTLDADMVVKSDFLLKTIPYFVDVEIREESRPEEERLHLGLLQTPQCFYDPDVFQHALYSERRAPNEQDFFYRVIEPAKTTTNSVIYGGSNTVLSRRALNDIGGFYTESITEDFATGLLIESAGYVSLSIPEPLASGQTPHTFKEHIQQRTRWARGVIVTAKKLKIWRRKNLTLAQKVSYWSSVVYWYSPIKNFIYILSPLLFAAFAIPVFKCNWLELIAFWLPMFIMQDLNLRVNSKNSISTKWSGIYETGVMAHLFMPVLKESVGISLSSFKVTDKSKQSRNRERDIRSMIPFLILTAVSVLGIIRVLVIFDVTQIVSFLILLFWIIRNMYFLIMSLFLIDGRDSDEEVVKVFDAEQVIVSMDGNSYEGVSTMLTEHNLTVFLDDAEALSLGRAVDVSVKTENVSLKISGVITGINKSRNGAFCTYTIEILEFYGDEMEWLEVLYDRIPTLPQSLSRDLGVLTHLWQNVAHRVARSRK